MHQAGFNVLDHPDYQPKESTFYIYDDAIIDSSTASYHEAETILNTIQALHIDGGKNSFKNMFLVGDQQLYDRVCVLVKRCPEQYSWVVPLAGDFHFTGHVLSCFNELWFLPFTSTIVHALGFEKVIKYKDDNITHFKHYDHFYLLLTAGILKFLSEIVDPALLASPELLLAQVSGHEGQRYYFLFQTLFNFFLRRQLYDGFVFV